MNEYSLNISTEMLCDTFKPFSIGNFETHQYFTIAFFEAIVQNTVGKFEMEGCSCTFNAT